MSEITEDPYAGESETYHFLTQETRYLILQYVLAHPENLPSLDELDHAIPKGKTTIHEHLEKLRERDVVDAYEVEDEKRTRDLPSTFYGLTEYGITLLEEFDLLQGKPVLQAMYANMDKPDEIQRYEDAPRPERKSRDELREELDETVAGDVDDDESARTVAGISNLLERESGGAAVSGSAAVRMELGTGILRLLESDASEDRGAAVSALAGIAKTSPEVVVPVLSELSGVVGELRLERQLAVSEIFEAVSSESPDDVPESAVERLIDLYGQGVEYWQRDFEVAREILNSGLEIGSNLGEDAIQIVCHGALGQIERRCDNLDEAKRHFEASLKSSEALGSDQGKARSLEDLGRVERMRANLDAAAHYHQRSLGLVEKIGDTHGEAKSLGNLGLVEQMRGNLEKATKYHQQSLCLEQEIGDIRGTAKSLWSLGRLSLKSGEYEDATDRFTEVFELFTDVGATRDAINAVNELTRVLIDQDRTDEAITYCDRGLELVEDTTQDHSEIAERLEERRAEARDDTETRTEQLYRTALRAAGHDDEEDKRITSRFREMWDLREDLDSGADAYDRALAAGVGLFAELKLLDIEETADAEETFVEELDGERDRLTAPAEALFDVLVSEEEDSRPDVLTDVPNTPAEAESLPELEQVAFATLYDRLHQSDNPLTSGFGPGPEFGMESTRQPTISD